MRAKFVHESLYQFTEEGGDLIKDMGIGKKYLIDKWFEEWAPDVEYTIDKDYNIFVDGDINLQKSNIKRLPDNLTINGSLRLNESQIKELPRNLIVGDFLNLDNCDIQKLPDDFLFKGRCLNLTKTPIESIPDIPYSYFQEQQKQETQRGINWLILSGCVNLKKLPNSLRVGGDLNLTSSSIKKLPIDLFVGGDLYLDNTEVTGIHSSSIVVGNIIKNDKTYKNTPRYKNKII